MKIREVVRYDINDDLMPLHPDFYRFVDRDERGYFIADLDGNRLEIVMEEKTDG
jgi:hypothetical protein